MWDPVGVRDLMGANHCSSPRLFPPTTTRRRFSAMPRRFGVFWVILGSGTYSARKVEQDALYSVSNGHNLALLLAYTLNRKV